MAYDFGMRIKNTSDGYVCGADEIEGLNLYVHRITMYGTMGVSPYKTYNVYVEFITKSSTPMTLNDICQKLGDIGTEIFKQKQCTGYAYASTSTDKEETRFASGMYGSRSNNTNYLTVYFYNTTQSISDFVSWKLTASDTINIIDLVETIF